MNIYGILIDLSVFASKIDETASNSGENAKL